MKNFWIGEIVESKKRATQVRFWLDTLSDADKVDLDVAAVSRVKRAEYFGNLSQEVKKETSGLQRGEVNAYIGWNDKVSAKIRAAMRQELLGTKF